MTFIKFDSGNLLNYQYTSVLIVDLLPIICGIMTSWTSPVIPKLLEDTEENTIGKILTVQEISWIGSLLALGAAVGPFLSAYLSHKFGRKLAMIFIAVVFVIALLFLTFAQNVYMMYAGRIIAGISQGSVFTVVPLYFAEISKNSNRGIIGNTVGLSIMIGSFVSYVVGPYVSIQIFNVICLIFPCGFLALAYFLPESPHFLISQGKDEKASDTYLKLGLGSTDDFKDSKTFLKSKIEMPLKEIVTSKIYMKIVFIALLIVSLKQLSGVTSIITYTQYIFDVAGTHVPSDVSSIIVASVGTIGGFIAPLIVDRYGRKILLIFSLIGTMLAQIFLGLYLHIDEFKSQTWLPVLCLVICVFLNIFGILSTVWIVMAEILPEKIKAMASAFINCLHWLLQFAITFVFPIISEKYGMGVAFWIFACFDFLGVIFILFMVPETKGKSAAEIERIFNKKL